MKIAAILQGIFVGCRIDKEASINENRADCKLALQWRIQK